MNLSFASGSLLWALMALPLLYWLVRLFPPKPKVIDFPAIRILLGLQPGTPPAQTPPWWLILLRVLLAALLIVAAAGPRLVPQTSISQNNMVLLIDNSWPAAAAWQDMQRTANTLMNEAATQHKQVWLWPLTEEAQKIEWHNAQAWQPTLNRLQPQQASLDLPKALKWLQKSLPRQTDVVLLSSGVVERLAVPDGKEGIDVSRVYVPGTLPQVVGHVAREGDALNVKILNLGTDAPEVTVELRDLDGKILSRAGTEKTENKGQMAKLVLTGLPAKAGYVTLQHQNHIAAWWGLSNIGGQPRVQVLAPKQNEFPLLSSRYYLQNALKEVAQARSGAELPSLLEELDAIVADQLPIQPENILKWVEDGGVYISLAGDWLKEHHEMNLLPSALRPQPRLLSGPLQLEGAMTLKGAMASGPLRDLSLDPAAIISQQWLPQNGWADGVETWLKLQDDTPLVSARKVGSGWLVLVHTGAEAAWSTLPLSGSFPGLLQKLVQLGQRNDAEAASPLPWAPQQLFDVYGKPAKLPASPIEDENTPVSITHPIGFYGAPAQPHMLDGKQKLLTAMPTGIWPRAQVLHYAEQSQSFDLTAWVLLLAFVLLLVDTALRLELLRPGRMIVLLAACLLPLSSHAQENGTLTQLGWIPSGNASVDSVTAAGLEGLSHIVNERTSIKLGTPQKLNLTMHSLGLYPVIIWPQVEGATLPEDKEAAALRAYVVSGGMLLIDSGTQLGEARLQTQRMLNEVLGVSLVPVDTEHTLERSFYLLKGQVIGRLGNKPLWRDTAVPLARLLVGAHDFSGAWAVNERGQYMLPMLAGGEVEREKAYRFGVNLVMYALLGDYKKDQLHVDTLLKLFEDEKR